MSKGVQACGVAAAPLGEAVGRQPEATLPLRGSRGGAFLVDSGGNENHEGPVGARDGDGLALAGDLVEDAAELAAEHQGGEGAHRWGIPGYEIP